MKQSILNDMSKEDRTDFYIAIPIILAALLFVLYYSFGNSTDLDEADYLIITENTMDIDTIMVGDATYEPMTTLKDRRKIIAPEKLQSRFSNNEVKTTKPTFKPATSNSDNTAQSSTIVTTLAGNTDTVVAAVDTVIATPITPEVKLDDTSDIVASKEATKTITPENQDASTQQAAQTNTSSSRDCIIIIGAYGKAANVTSVMGKLTNEGYDAFTTPYKGLTRVGFYHTCELKKLQATLLKVRRTYAKDAMVLNKK